MTRTKGVSLLDDLPVRAANSVREEISVEHADRAGKLRRQALAWQAGADGSISPHSMRQTFATIALDNGVTLHDLQDSLGPADPRTARRYDRSRHKMAKSAGYDVTRAVA